MSRTSSHIKYCQEHWSLDHWLQCA